MTNALANEEFKLELTCKTFPIFDSWTRKVTNTEFVAERLRESLGLIQPNEHTDIYRVQPKVTGVERRHALCYLSRNGCDDITGLFNGKKRYFGIDLINPVNDLAKADSITVECKNDLFLWVYVTQA